MALTATIATKTVINTHETVVVYDECAMLLGNLDSGQPLLTMVSGSFKTACHWSAKRAFPALLLTSVLSVLLAFSFPKTAAAESSQLTREQLAIIFMLLRNSSDSEESSAPNTDTGSGLLRIKRKKSGCGGDLPELSRH